MVEPGLGDGLGQSYADVRFEWGPVGARHLADGAACLVVVDVLSFTTAVTVAVARGTIVFPYRWDDDSAGTSLPATTPSSPCAAGRCPTPIRGRCPPPP